MTAEYFIKYIFIIVSFSMVFISCFSKSEDENKNQTFSNTKENYENTSSNYSDEEEISNSNDEENRNADAEETNEDDDELNSSSGCNFEDGTHSATVDYYNPETGYSQTYTLDVEVEDCEVVQINFPKGGWLDSDHITPAELDEDGSCNIDGEEGKTYEIQIDD
jgi:hypothetical protein